MEKLLKSFSRPAESPTLTPLRPLPILREAPNSKPGNGFRRSMSLATTPDLAEYCRDTARQARAAAADLAMARGAQKNAWLELSAANLRSQAAVLLEANSADVAAASGFGLTEAQVDRLRLTPKRINDIAVGLEQVAVLPDPVG